MFISAGVQQRQAMFSPLTYGWFSVFCPVLALNKRNYGNQAAARKYGKWSAIVSILSIVVTVVVVIIVVAHFVTDIIHLVYQIIGVVEKLNGTSIDFHSRDRFNRTRSEFDVDERNLTWRDRFRPDVDNITDCPSC